MLIVVDARAALQVEGSYGCSSVISTFLVSAGMFAAILFLPLFVQAVLGNSAINSGYVLTPLMLGFIGTHV